jgi:hypothetical protein
MRNGRFQHFGALPINVQEQVVSKLNVRNAAALAVTGRAGRVVAEKKVQKMTDKTIDVLARHIAAVMMVPVGANGRVAPRADTRLYVNLAGARFMVMQFYGAGPPQSPVESVIYAEINNEYRKLASIGTQPLLDRPHSLRLTKGAVWWASVFTHPASHRSRRSSYVASRALDRAYELANAESQARGTGQLGYVKVTGAGAGQQPPKAMVVDVRPLKRPRKQREPRAAPLQ